MNIFPNIVEFPYMPSTPFEESGNAIEFEESEHLPPSPRLQGNFPLHRAVEDNCVWDTFRLCCEPSVDVNQKNLDDATPLINSVKFKFTDITKTLINTAAGRINLDTADHEERTALIWAVQRNNSIATNLLLDAGANANLTDKFGESPLICASRLGNLEVLSSLISALEKSADKDNALNGKTKDGQTALTLAIEGKHVGAVKMLFSAGADAHQRGPRGESLLELALATNHQDLIATVLLEIRSKFSQESHPVAVSDSCIRDAIRLGKWEGLEILSPGCPNIVREIKSYLYASAETLSRAAQSSSSELSDFYQAPEKKLNPLMVAIEMRLPGATKILIAHDADLVNMYDAYSELPLMRSAELGDMDSLDLLLKNGATPYFGNSLGESSFSYAAKHGQIDAFRHLVHNSIDCATSAFWPGTKAATSFQQTETLEIILNEFVAPFLEQGGDLPGFTDVSPEGYTVPYYAAAFNKTDALRVLLRMSERLNFPDNAWSNALDTGAEKGFDEIVGLLLRRSWTQDQLRDALELAAGKGHTGIVRALLARCERPESLTKALLMAAQGGHDSVFKLLVSHRVDPRAALPAIVDVASTGCAQIASALLNLDDVDADLRDEALAAGALHGHLAMVQLMLAHGAPLNAAEPHFVSIAANGHAAMVKLLLQLPIAAPRLERAILEAAQNGHSQIVDILHQAGVKLHHAAPAFVDACVGGHTEVVRTLLNSEALLINMEEPLIQAAGWGRVDVFRLILEKGELTRQALAAAMIEAAFEGHAEILELAHDKLKSSSTLGRSLTEAARNGRRQAVKVLLEKSPAQTHALNAYIEVKQRIESLPDYLGELRADLHGVKRGLEKYLGVTASQ